MLYRATLQTHLKMCYSQSQQSRQANPTHITHTNTVFLPIALNSVLILQDTFVFITSSYSEKLFFLKFSARLEAEDLRESHK